MANSTITLKLPKTFTQEKFNEYIIHLSSGYIMRIPDYFEFIDGDSFEALLNFNFSFIERPTYKVAVLRYPINASTNLYELDENDISVESNINVQITDDSVVLSYTFAEGTDLSNIIYDMNETDVKSIFGDDFFRVGDSPTPQKSEKFLNNSGLSHYDTKIKQYIDTQTEKAMSITSGGRSFIGTPTETGYMRIKDGAHAGTEQINLMYDLARSTNTLSLMYETSGDFEHDKEFIIPATDYVDSKVGDLSTLTTDNTDNLVNAINEVYEKSGEPFRVKNWSSNTLNVTVPCCTKDIANTSIGKMDFVISGEEGDNYQVVGMIAYEVFDAASGGNRINCFPICQFTGNGQKTLSVRWMCGGTTDKVAKRINAWVLLKHR